MGPRYRNFVRLGALLVCLVLVPQHAPGKANDPGAAAEQVRPPRHLRFATVDKGPKSCWVPPDASAAGRPHLLAFRDEASWQEFWAQHACGRAVPAPRIRFPQRMAIVYIAGEASGSTAAEILEIVRDRNARTLFVHTEETQEPVLLPVILNPYHIVTCRNVRDALVLLRDVVQPFRTLDIGTGSGHRYGDPSFGGERMILRDEWGWLDVWNRHTSLQSPPPPPPPVKFPGEMVLAAFFGHWPASGAWIEIVKVTRTWAGTLRVEYVQRAEIGPLDVLTNPYHFVATPMWPGTVYFTERKPVPPPRP